MQVIDKNAFVLASNNTWAFLVIKVIFFNKTHLFSKWVPCGTRTEYYNA